MDLGSMHLSWWIKGENKAKAKAKAKRRAKRMRNEIFFRCFFFARSQHLDARFTQNAKAFTRQPAKCYTRLTRVTRAYSLLFARERACAQGSWYSRDSKWANKRERGVRSLCKRQTIREKEMRFIKMRWKSCPKALNHELAQGFFKYRAFGNENIERILDQRLRRQRACRFDGN